MASDRKVLAPSQEEQDCALAQALHEELNSQQHKAPAAQPVHLDYSAVVDKVRTIVEDMKTKAQAFPLGTATEDVESLLYDIFVTRNFGAPLLHAFHADSNSLAVLFAEKIVVWKLHKPKKPVTYEVSHTPLTTPSLALDTHTVLLLDWKGEAKGETHAEAFHRKPPYNTRPVGISTKGKLKFPRFTGDGHVVVLSGVQGVVVIKPKADGDAEAIGTAEDSTALALGKCSCEFIEPFYIVAKTDKKTRTSTLYCVDVMDPKLPVTHVHSVDWMVNRVFRHKDTLACVDAANSFIRFVDPLTLEIKEVAYLSGVPKRNTGFIGSTKATAFEHKQAFMFALDIGVQNIVTIEYKTPTVFGLRSRDTSGGSIVLLQNVRKGAVMVTRLDDTLSHEIVSASKFELPLHTKGSHILWTKDRSYLVVAPDGLNVTYIYDGRFTTYLLTRPLLPSVITYAWTRGDTLYVSTVEGHLAEFKIHHKQEVVTLSHLVDGQGKPRRSERGCMSFHRGDVMWTIRSTGVIHKLSTRSSTVFEPPLHSKATVLHAQENGYYIFIASKDTLYSLEVDSESWQFWYKFDSDIVAITDYDQESIVVALKSGELYGVVLN